MTDREMLMLTYGAIKAGSYGTSSLKEVAKIMEDHLFKPTVTALIVPGDLKDFKNQKPGDTNEVPF